MATIGDSTSESSPMKDDNTENLPAIAKDGTEPSEKASNSVMCGPVLREQLRIFGEIAANKANGKRVDEKESDENGAVGTNKPRNSWPNNKANNNNGKLQEESVENVKGLTNNSKSPGSKATQFRSSYLGFTVNFDHAEENSITSNAKDEEIGEEFQNKLTRGDNSQDDNKSSTASMPTAPQMKQRNNVGEIIGKRPAADRNNAQGKAIQDAICLPEQKITKSSFNS